jgi:hypothetical protein
MRNASAEDEKFLTSMLPLRPATIGAETAMYNILAYTYKAERNGHRPSGWVSS